MSIQANTAANTHTTLPISNKPHSIDADNSSQAIVPHDTQTSTGHCLIFPRAGIFATEFGSYNDKTKHLSLYSSKIAEIRTDNSLSDQEKYNKITQGVDHLLHALQDKNIDFSTIIPKGINAGVTSRMVKFIAKNGNIVQLGFIGKTGHLKDPSKPESNVTGKVENNDNLAQAFEQELYEESLLKPSLVSKITSKPFSYINGSANLISKGSTLKPAAGSFLLFSSPETIVETKFPSGQAILEHFNLFPAVLTQLHDIINSERFSKSKTDTIDWEAFNEELSKVTQMNLVPQNEMSILTQMFYNMKDNNVQLTRSQIDLGNGIAELDLCINNIKSYPELNPNDVKNKNILLKEATQLKEAVTMATSYQNFCELIGCKQVQDSNTIIDKKETLQQLERQFLSLAIDARTATVFDDLIHGMYSNGGVDNLALFKSDATLKNTAIKFSKGREALRHFTERTKDLSTPENF